MASSMSFNSAAVASRCAASSVGSHVPGSFMTLIRAGMCPTPTPKLIRGIPLPLCVPLIHVVRARFQFQRGGHAIARLELIIARLLSVLMQINESRRDDQSARFDRFFPAQLLF